MTSASFWLAEQPLILASRSAARRKMLDAAGIPYELQPADVDERAIEDEARRNGAGPEQVARALAHAKAARIVARNPHRIVMGSDQTLDLDGAVLSKPGGHDQAAAQLRLLSGRAHRLWSAAVVMRDAETLADVTDCATLRLRPLSDVMIETYLAAAGADVLQCAGTYQLEGAGVHIFESAEGDYWTILGLPLLSLCASLRAQGLLVA
jgi:septum formation protein